MGYVKYIGVCGWLSVSTEAEKQGPGVTLELGAVCSGEEGTRANPRNSEATAAAVPRENAGQNDADRPRTEKVSRWVKVIILRMEGRCAV